MSRKISAYRSVLLPAIYVLKNMVPSPLKCGEPGVLLKPR